MNTVPAAPTGLTAEVSGPAMPYVERMRLRAAALYARRIHPGPVGELLAQELEAWEEFGYRLGGHGLIHGVVEAILREDEPGAA